MKLVVTYCSGPKEKKPGPLPAVQRYLSTRIQDLAASGGESFRILSGEFGLLEANEPIPWYDHLLTQGEVMEMAVTVADQLLEYETTSVDYHTADVAEFTQVKPYAQVMAKACGFADVSLNIILLEGNPD